MPVQEEVPPCQREDLRAHRDQAEEARLEVLRYRLLVLRLVLRGLVAQDLEAEVPWEQLQHVLRVGRLEAAGRTGL